MTPGWRGATLGWYVRPLRGEHKMATSAGVPNVNQHEERPGDLRAMREECHPAKQAMKYWEVQQWLPLPCRLETPPSPEPIQQLRQRPH